ncbi:GlcG/HbpS family heme-binding protein [Novosphingobium malaysiense]|uniref:GlcG protein n=1 Tax=Novosphingobium malaysiense TaxID=1348853 RepID=A0A0B1ZKJ7_9SPHN|nr:heme-binding protein [Novosphingobium malaysiense]KHK89820.1 GlcG protein [Novosphingobium malaysiense]
MTTITLEQANTISAAAFAKGRDLGLKPLAVAVVDAGGHLISYQRQDGASIGRLQIASGKACGALFLGVSSRTVAEMAADRPTFIATAATVAPQGLIPAPGGVIVVDKDGSVIGAVGISGDTSDNDEACTLAGISAAGLSEQ